MAKTSPKYEVNPFDIGDLLSNAQYNAPPPEGSELSRFMGATNLLQNPLTDNAAPTRIAQPQPTAGQKVASAITPKLGLRNLPSYIGINPQNIGNIVDEYGSGNYGEAIPHSLSALANIAFSPITDAANIVKRIPYVGEPLVNAAMLPYTAAQTGFNMAVNAASPTLADAIKSTGSNPVLNTMYPLVGTLARQAGADPNLGLSHGAASAWQDLASQGVGIMGMDALGALRNAMVDPMYRSPIPFAGATPRPDFPIEPPPINPEVMTGAPPYGNPIDAEFQQPRSYGGSFLSQLPPTLAQRFLPEGQANAHLDDVTISPDLKTSEPSLGKKPLNFHQFASSEGYDMSKMIVDNSPEYVKAYKAYLQYKKNYTAAAEASTNTQAVGNAGSATAAPNVKGQPNASTERQVSQNPPEEHQGGSGELQGNRQVREQPPSVPQTGDTPNNGGGVSSTGQVTPETQSLIDKLNTPEQSSVPPAEATPRAGSKIEGLGEASATIPLVLQAVAALKRAGEVPKFTSYKSVLNNYLAVKALNEQNANSFINAFHDKYNDVTGQAVTVLREAKYDPQTIENQLRTFNDIVSGKDKSYPDADVKVIKKYIPAWERAEAMAINKDPNDIAIAQAFDKRYADGAQEAKDEGVLQNMVDDYANHQWKRGSFGMDKRAGGTPSNLATSFSSAKQRSIPTYFEGILRGGTPETINAGNLWGEWIKSKNNVVAGRKFADALTKTNHENGQPLAVREFPVANDNEVYKARTGARSANTSKYERVTNPIFHDYKFHPDIAEKLDNAFKQSWIETSNSKLARSLHYATVGTTAMKQELMSLSPFHITQSGSHATGHVIDPFDIKPVDLNKAEDFDAVAHSLNLGSENAYKGNAEGLMSKDGYLQKAIDAAVKAGVKTVNPEFDRMVFKDLTDWTFQKFIPSLKIQTYEKVLGKNMERFSKEIESGKYTKDDIKYMTAREVNNAFGELNYKDMGRNPTVQQVLRLVLLAPDFLEARARFTGQALTGLYSKTYHEQSITLARIAIGNMIAAQTMNLLINHKMDLTHPFQAKVGDKYYGLRTQATDLYDLAKDAYDDVRAIKAGAKSRIPGGFFIRSRFSPLMNMGLEAASGEDYAERARNWKGELKDFVGMMTALPTHAIPGFPGSRAGFNTIEQLIQSAGITGRKDYQPKLKPIK